MGKIELSNSQKPYKNRTIIDFIKCLEFLLALTLDECQYVCYITDRTKETDKIKSQCSEQIIHNTSAIPECAKIIFNRFLKGDMTYDVT